MLPRDQGARRPDFVRQDGTSGEIISPKRLLSLVQGWDDLTAKAEAPKLDHDCLLYLGRHLPQVELRFLLDYLTLEQRVFLNNAYGIADCADCCQWSYVDPCDRPCLPSGITLPDPGVMTRGGHHTIQCKHYRAVAKRPFTLPDDILTALFISIYELDDRKDD